MINKYQYNTEEEKQTILEQNKDKIWIEEWNITEGNFLIFTDIPPVETQLQNIQNNTDMILLKQEGII